MNPVVAIDAHKASCTYVVRHWDQTPNEREVQKGCATRSSGGHGFIEEKRHLNLWGVVSVSGGTSDDGRRQTYIGGTRPDRLLRSARQSFCTYAKPPRGLEQAHYCCFIAGPVDARREPVEANNAQLILEDAKRQLLDALPNAHLDSVNNPLVLSRSSWIERAGIPNDRVAAKAVSQLVKDGNAMAATIEYRFYVPASPEGAATIRELGTKGAHTLDRARTLRWIMGLGLAAIFIALGSLGSSIESGGSETAANEWGARETSLVLLGITMGGYLTYILSSTAHPIANQMHRLHGALGDHFKAVIQRVPIALLIAVLVTYLALGVLSKYLEVAEAIQVALSIFIAVASGVGYITFQLSKKNAEG